MGNSTSSEIETTPLHPSESPQFLATGRIDGNEKTGYKDPRSPSAEIKRTPLRQQQSSFDPRSPSRDLQRTPLCITDYNSYVSYDTSVAAGKKKLFNGEKPVLLDQNM